MYGHLVSVYPKRPETGGVRGIIDHGTVTITWICRETEWVSAEPSPNRVFERTQRRDQMEIGSKELKV